MLHPERMTRYNLTASVLEKYTKLWTCQEYAARPRTAVAMSYLVFCAYGSSDDELVNVIELIPVLIAGVHVPEQRLKLWPSGNGHIERLGCDEGVSIEQIEVVLICEVAQQLPCKSPRITLHLLQIHNTDPQLVSN